MRPLRIVAFVLIGLALVLAALALATPVASSPSSCSSSALCGMEMDLGGIFFGLPALAALVAGAILLLIDRR